MFRFSPLCVSDLPRLCDWLNRPHMRLHYQQSPTTLAEVTETFTPRIQGKHPVLDHIASYNETPIGKLQCYSISAYPDYAHDVGLRRGIGIDLFIGEPTMLRRGLGREMLRQYATNVAFPLHPEEAECCICHGLTNSAARACSRAAGFQPVREVTEDGVASELLVLRRRP